MKVNYKSEDDQGRWSLKRIEGNRNVCGMNISFPEDLLNSSFLVPIKDTLTKENLEAFISEKRGSSTAQNKSRKRSLVSTPRPEQTLSTSPISNSKRIILPSPFHFQAITDGCNPLLESMSQNQGGRLCRIQFELAKERELYTMHANAAAKSFERINNLLDELSDITRIGMRPESIISSQSHVDESVSKISLRESSKPSNKFHEAIKDVSITVKSRFFSRKPRCLLFPGSEVDDLMITSSLDGSIQYWSMKSQTVIRSLHIPAFLNRSCHAEGMCLARTLNGFIVSTVDVGPSNGNKGELDPANTPGSIIFLPFSGDSIISPVQLDSPSNPHQKAISTIACFQNNDPEHFRFITGGLDKNITLWEVNDQLEVINIHDLHRTHTSAIQAIAQVKQRSEILWSGGTDCRLIGWSLVERRSTFSHRFNHRISYLLSNETHPHTLLATFCSTTKQLQVLDTRAPLSQNHISFGHDELSPISRYLRPSWSPSGNLIAMGTSAPQSRVSAINVWDIRYIRNDSTLVRTIECGSERRFLACDFWPTGNTIVALGSDCSASFVDFTTS